MIYIVKRSGAKELYHGDKIIVAMHKAFISKQVACDDALLQQLLQKVEEKLAGLEDVPVEQIQDTVEQVLMEAGQYPVAKSYILYRERRTRLRAAREHLVAALTDKGIAGFLEKIQLDFEDYDLARLDAKYV